jgi:hypothetical protein
MSFSQSSRKKLPQGFFSGERNQISSPPSEYHQSFNSDCISQQRRKSFIKSSGNQRRIKYSIRRHNEPIKPSRPKYRSKEDSR